MTKRLKKIAIVLLWGKNLSDHMVLEKYVGEGNIHFVRYFAWLRGLDVHIPLPPNNYFTYEEVEVNGDAYAIVRLAEKILERLKRDLPGVPIGYEFKANEPAGGIYQSFPVGRDVLHWIIVGKYTTPGEKLFAQGHEDTHMIAALDLKPYNTRALLDSELAKEGFYGIPCYTGEEFADVGGFLAMHKRGFSIATNPYFANGVTHDNVRETMHQHRAEFLKALRARIETLIGERNTALDALETAERYYGLASREDGEAASLLMQMYLDTFERNGDTMYIKKAMDILV